MNKFPRIILIVAIISSLLSSFVNYINSGQNIDELAYVMAIGIDIGNTEKYKISFQLSSIKSTSSEVLASSSDKSDNKSESSSSESSSQNSIINTVETNSIDNAINIANSFTNKPINLSHCKVVVISEDLAKQGIKDIIYTLINKEEIRPDCNLVISQIPSEEFSGNSVPKLEELISKYYDIAPTKEVR